ncbi:MAG: A/G-specific adenine glycosylase, partial [Micrococcales bacterium]|nr:A/G-specific adenine glycosylase [Micrococcales bacterium]
AYRGGGVGACASGGRRVVLDTTVRRVEARAVSGRALAAPSQTAAETRLATTLVPSDPATSARWNVAVMELGALVCVARSPRCGSCPIRERCAWQTAGAPPYDGPPRRGQAWHGTDRQVRGRILALMRGSPDPLARAELAVAWPDDPGRVRRCLAGLVQDGLIEPETQPGAGDDGASIGYRLPR